MSYEIDQSGKIEDTAKNTVIAYSNGTMKSVLIRKKLKRKIQEYFRRSGFHRLFIYQTFSIGIYFLIRDFQKQESIVIDTEYPGKEKIINRMLHRLLEAYGKPAHHIYFKRIGNKPKAHYAAKDVFDGKKKADFILDFGDIVGAIKKTDGHLRECLSTLVGAQPRSMPYFYQKNLKMSSRKK